MLLSNGIASLACPHPTADFGSGGQSASISWTIHAPGTRLAVKPVVLSQAFPARFEPYDAKVFLLEVSHQNIDMKALCSHQDASVHSLKAHPHKQYFLGRLCTHQLRFRLVLRTSRGHRAIPISVSSVQRWDYLDSYAVHKAAFEEKIVFPE